MKQFKLRRWSLPTLRLRNQEVIKTRTFTVITELKQLFDAFTWMLFEKTPVIEKILRLKH
jgi:hypothetical protein